MKIVKSLLLFILAGLCEIGGGYLIWLWLKADRNLYGYGILGGCILVLYGIVCYLANRQLWQGVRRLRRGLYCAGAFLCLES